MDGANGNGNNSNHNGGDAGVGCNAALSHDPPNPRLGQRVSVNLDMLRGSPLTINWEILDPDGLGVTLTLRNDDYTAEFVAEKSGTYSATVSVASDVGHCDANDSVNVSPPNAATENVIVMLTPADLSLAPRQRKTLEIVGHTPRTDLQFNLEQGLLASVALEGPDGPMAGYVRITPSGSTLHHEGYYSPQSNPIQFRLLGTAIHDVLVVPDTETVAPAAISGLSVTEIQNAATFQFDRGVAVQGTVLDPNATGLTDARVVLRCDDVPSGVGVASMITGAFSLYARPGTCTVALVPPEGSQWPELTVPDTGGVTVTEGVPLSLDFAFRDLTFRTFSGRVLSSDGSTPVPDARITLLSESLADPGELTITSDGSPVGPDPVTGRFRQTQHSQADGSFAYASVPSGIYTALVEPPSDRPSILKAIDLTTGDLIDHSLQLAQPVRLFGTVEGEPEEAGGPVVPVSDARVVAVTDLGTGSSIETVTDQGGNFQLLVTDGATYTIRFVPDAQSGFASLPGFAVEVLGVAGEMRLLDPGGDNPLLLRGLELSGTVLGEGSGAGVLVQVFCQACGHNLPVAETFTDAARAFTLSVPDPGLEETTP
jgi:hypothetical protein